MSLAGPKAFAALAAILDGRSAPSEGDFADHVYARFFGALTDHHARSLDLAVLMRHILQIEAARRGDGSEPALPAPIGAHSVDLTKAGLDQRSDGRWHAAPWHPDWLSIPSGALSPDAAAAQARRRRFGRGDHGTQGDPFLGLLGRDTYRSVGQRAGVRAALLTPAGATTAVDLPTGDGKSLIFQIIDRLGFASNRDETGMHGVTLVVVPTIALAYDHENKCRREPDEVLAYVGGADLARRTAILERVSKAQSGLVFAAPESCCGSLRGPLRIAATNGRLKAIVVDEAHLVDAWGTGFRTDFQSLSGLRAELIDAAPEGLAPRTLLLSATLTPETLETLRTLFSEPGEMRTLAAAQVRPEPEYWVSEVSDPPVRDARVEEALSRLPRPAILYVTEVREAIAWHDRLKAAGYGRIAAFHGRTPDDERQATLRQWGAGALDLVVATSAFGLGIDYPHVRAILHACVPETFDRFYQEVGRGGRDGCEAASLVLPTRRDYEIAKSLNTERLITVERGLERWTAMFRHPDTLFLGGSRFRLRLDVAPGQGVDDIDLVGERSLQWNGRIVTLMARARLLRLSGNSLDSDLAAAGVYEFVEILEPGHLEKTVWERRVGPVRAAIAAARQHNFDLMTDRLRDRSCPSDAVLELYGRDRVDMVCGRCSLCRADPLRASPTALRREPPSCWPTPDLDPVLSGMLGHDGRLLVTYNSEADGLTDRRRAATAVKSLWRSGARSLALWGEPYRVFERALADLVNLPVFVSRIDSLTMNRLPPGPQVVIVGRGVQMERPTGVAPQPRIILIPQDHADPDRPGESLVDRWPGPILTLANLLSRILT